MKTSDDNAVELGVTQAQNWVAHNYADDLNGKQVRAIVSGVSERLIPFLKISDYNEVADMLDTAVEAVAKLLDADDPADGDTFRWAGHRLTAEVRASAAKYLEEVRGGR